jgi:hypothetical protein
MGDWFNSLVDPVIDEKGAEELCDATIVRFRDLGLITGEPDAECVLGGKGYRPGPALHDFLDDLGMAPSPFHLKTNGVEPQIGRHFNAYAIGPNFLHLTCPACAARFDDIRGVLLEQIGDGFSNWIERGEFTDVVCPRCGKATAVNGWECKPPIGFGNLAFTFWNWPHFDSPGWRIDLRKIVSDVTGHPTVYTWGKI